VSIAGRRDQSQPLSSVLKELFKIPLEGSKYILILLYEVITICGLL